MKLFSKVAPAVAMVVLFSGCASIVSKSSWPLSINSTPAGAKVEILNRKGVPVFNGVTPANTTLSSGAGFFTPASYTIKLNMDGYAQKVIPVKCTLNGWYVGNVIFGGLIGLLIVDPATGAMYRLDAEYINETLDKNTVDNKPELKILDVNHITPEMKAHLVSLK
ncbi:hypothetical protein [Parabacteroides sp. FAFU027]|uniref:hypothetical protein n=1 Tax=Parabacteroides sp. FAFU027 TaxID=2922715 RepID=UPI001FAEAFCA|nr:hypothetical protein [Parabacteroides sp. FAFU027]